MAKLKDAAKEYEPAKTKNIADLEAVSLDAQFEERNGKRKDGTDFSYQVIVVLGEEYRVPDSVLKDIQTMIEAKPALKTIKVIKKGTGMSTTYTVVPLE